MNDPVDARLAELFSGLDTRPEFNARLLERLHREITEEVHRAEDARKLEHLRHQAATLELQSGRQWKEALGRFLNLETVGIGVLAVTTISSAWSADQIRQAMPLVLSAAGLLLAFAPVLAPIIRSRRWAR